MNQRTEPARTVLIVDDEARIRDTLSMHLQDEGHVVVEAETTAAAEALLADHPVDCILLDVRMPGEDGVTFLKRRADIPRETPVVVMSGHGTIELAIEAVRLGAHDFLEKGFSPERLAITLERAFTMNALRRRNQELQAGLSSLHAMVGQSPAMDSLRDAVQRAAPTPAKVLLLGENGVGKELVARAIHELSPRREESFVRLNCAAIPRDLVESELFGHEKGAFTGASARKRGKLELAHGGTLFLDEIGDMDLSAQAKLLRALESNEFERVGGARTLQVDARILAATNKDLAAETAAGSFRKDLFYRLNVLPIVVPPLRERTGDVPLLVRHYLDFFQTEYGRSPIIVDAKATALLERYPWPGNVRELRNLVERLVIMVPESEIREDAVARILGADRPTEAADSGVGLNLTIPSGEDGYLKRAMEAAERALVEQELTAVNWNVSEAARRLGIDRANLHRKLRRLGLERDPEV